MADHERFDEGAPDYYATHRESSVPTAVTLALGVLASGTSAIRNLPESAVRLPMTGLAFALNAAATLRERYMKLLSVGEGVVGLLRGQPTGESSPVVAESAEDTQAVEVEAREIARAARAARAGQSTPTAEQGPAPAKRAPRRKANGSATAATAPSPPTAGPPTAGPPAVATPTEQPAAPAAGTVPSGGTPASTETPQVDQTALEFGAPGAAAPIADQVAEQVHASAAPAEGQELPIPDLDHLTLAAVRAKMRRLDIEQLVLVRDYEQAHAHRLPVVTMLDNRIAKLQLERESTGPAGDEGPGPVHVGARPADEDAVSAAATDAASADEAAGELDATARP